MELKSYLTILWRRKYIIAATLLITVAVAGAGTRFLAPVYAASVTLQVTTTASGSLGYVEYDLDYADRLMNTYTYIADSGPVRNELMARFRLKEPPAVSVEILANTELIVLTVEAGDASLAADLANALAAILVQRGKELISADVEHRRQELEPRLAQIARELSSAQEAYDQLLAQTPASEPILAAALEEIAQWREMYGVLLTQFESLHTRAVVQTNLVTVMDPATPPLSPVRPNLALNLGLGLFLGLVAGMGLAFLFENLDSRLHTIEQIETVTGLPMLARIPVAKHAQWPDIVMNSHSIHEEAYSRLSAKLATHVENSSALIILVTSAEPGEGKSTVTANLATAMARAGHSVIAIDCNLHHPSLHEIFHLPNETGLAKVLLNNSGLNKAIQATIVPNLRVIPGGECLFHPSELFTPTRLASLVAQLKARADITFLDAPAYLSAVETLALSTIADGIVFVVGQSIAHEEAVTLARRELATGATKLMGVVVTRTAQPMISRYVRS